MSDKKPAIAPAGAVEEAAADAPSPSADAAPSGGIVRPFVRVIDLRTGHEYDVHRQSLDPEVHRLLKDVEDSWSPRPATPNPNPGPVEG